MMIIRNKFDGAVLCGLVLACILGTLRSAPALNVAAPTMQKLRETYAEEKKVLDADHAAKLKTMVARYASDAEALLQEKTRAGNISGMAVARAGVKIFETAAEEIEKDGNFALPERVRRELRPTLDELTREKQGLDAEYQAAVAMLDAGYKAKLAQEGAASGETDITADQIDAFFLELINAAAVPDAGAPDGGAPDGSGEPGGAVAPINQAPSVIASSGDAESWVPIARWYGAVSGIEIIDIKTGGREQREEKEVKGSSPIGQPYEITYEPLRRFTPRMDALFQLRTLPGYEVPDVVGWPTSRNDWALQLRVRPAREVPSKHGIEILVAFPGAETLPLLTGGGGDVDDGTRVKIGIKTLPDQAYVYVDGRPLREGRGFLKTPCTVPVRPGKRNIRLRIFGYKDAVVSDFEAAEGRVINWRFEKDPRMAEKTVTVAATGRAWQTAGLSVSSGDTISVKATGEWHCGSGKEPVDGNGYPNNKDFFSYYIDPQKNPRLYTRANYGALLMRIGKDGPAVKIGTGTKVTADRSGDVYFDINEAQDLRVRRDNGGSLFVHVRKAPGQ